MSEKKFNLRPFRAEDLFPMVSILSKIGVEDLKNAVNPESIKTMMDKAKGDNSEGDAESQMQTLGVSVIIQVAGIIMKNLPSCRADIYNLLSSLSEMPPTEIAKLPMADFAEMVIQVIKKEDFKDFFGVVFKSFK